MNVAIVANPDKYEVKQTVARTVNWAKHHNVHVFIDREVCTRTEICSHEVVHQVQSDVEAIAQADIVLVMGGDGTMLYTARILGNQEKPILGINSGRLGFMANTQVEELEAALNHVLTGDYTLDKRVLLTATDNNGGEFYALNEFLFTRKDSTRMVNITAKYGDSLINTYWADGLIVATPTGSTAYNLSSGGPIVPPGTNVILVTPINPHTLTTRPLVVSAQHPLTILIEPQETEILFSYDGVQCEIQTLPFEVHIGQSDRTLNLIHLPGHDYFETLRNKLMWGLDSRRIKN
ncbi:MAG: NAD(+)/NADH kinase [Bacteroidota bacterium]